MLDGLKHTHTLLVTIFLLSYIIKTFLLVSGKREAFLRYRKRFLMPEMIITILFLLTGVYMWWSIGFGNIAGWFHVKISLVLFGIAFGIIGFRRENKALAIISTLIFLYIFILAFTKNTLLFF